MLQKSFDDLHLDFETSAFKMQKEGPRFPRTSNLNKGQVAGSTRLFAAWTAPMLQLAKPHTEIFAPLISIDLEALREVGKS